VTVAPRLSSSYFALSARSLVTWCMTSPGALSTRSSASLSRIPVKVLNALMTRIFRLPADTSTRSQLASIPNPASQLAAERQGHERRQPSLAPAGHGRTQHQARERP